MKLRLFCSVCFSLILMFFNNINSQTSNYSNKIIHKQIIKANDKQIIKDFVQIMYEFTGDVNRNYDVELCIKDSLYPSFALFPKVYKGNIGVGKFAGQRNLVSMRVDQLPEDFPDNLTYYYEVTVREIIDEIELRDINRLDKELHPYINEGVAVIIGIDDDINRTTYIQNSAQLFNDYCLRVLNISFKKTFFELNRNASKDNLESVFRKDGWLHNSITDGLSDVIIYFAGSSVINTNNEILLLPSDAKSLNDGFLMDDLISSVQGYNPRSLTIIIESFIKAELNAQIPSSIFFYPREISNKTNIIMACRGNQKNYFNEEEKMSLFTYYILKGLSSSADLNNDRNITFKELYEYVKKNVWQYSVDVVGKEQEPVLFPNLEEIGESAGRIILTRD